MAQFAGKRVCGKPLQKGFIDQTRPEDMEGKCPSGYQPCNSDITPDNIVCMPEKDLDIVRDCPILDLEIRKKSEFPDWTTQALHRIVRVEKEE